MGNCCGTGPAYETEVPVGGRGGRVGVERGGSNGYALGDGRGGGGGYYQQEPQIKQPDPEEKRRQLAEAAEKRIKAQEHRGVKDLEAVRRQQRRQEEMERLEREAVMQGGGQAPLRWQMS